MNMRGVQRSVRSFASTLISSWSELLMDRLVIEDASARLSATPAFENSSYDPQEDIIFH